MPEHVHVDILAPAGDWSQRLDKLPQLVTNVVMKAVQVSGRVHNACEVCVILSDDRELQILNREHRNIDKPTNILSFPGEPLDDDEGSYALGDRPLVLGDLVIAYETMVREAEEARKPLADHLAHILIHGSLHLCRYDHENETDAERMESLERDIMKDLGLDDPYADEGVDVEAASP